MRWRVLACLLVTFVVAAGCSGPTDGRLEEPRQAVDEGPLDGNTITVSGEVTDVFEGGAFLVNGEDLSFSDASATLILGPDDADVTQGAFARIRGVVERLAADSLDEAARERYGEEVLAQHEGEYVVRADTVTAIPRPSSAAEALEQALDDPDSEVRETLTLSAEVKEVIAPQVFWIAGRGEEGIAVVTALRPEIDEGDVVLITGTVRRFSPEIIQQEAGITLRSDIADELRQSLDNGVVFVAESVALANTEG